MSSACTCHEDTSTCYWCLWEGEKKKNEQLLQEIKRMGEMNSFKNKKIINLQNEKAIDSEILNGHIQKFNNTPTTVKAKKAFNAFKHEVERLNKENDRLQAAIKQCKKTLERIAFDADVQFFEKWIDLAKEEIERLNKLQLK